MRFILCLILCLVGSLRAHAEGMTNSTDMTVTVSGTVNQVIDPRTLVLEDGTVVTLLGIDVPTAGFVPPSPLARDAYALLKKSALHKQIDFFQGVQQTVLSDSYGRLLAVAVIPGDKTSIQENLLQAGVARVWDGDDTRTDLSPFLAAEETARQEKKGLWQENGLYGEFTPTTIPMTAIGMPVTVIGTIQSVLTLDNDIYLFLTTEGPKGFYARVPAAIRPELMRQGIDPLTFQGKMIRLRGVLRMGTAPYIESIRTWQMELLSTNVIQSTSGGNADAFDN